MAKLERAEEKRENFSLRKINTETWKQDGQQTEQDLGLMELLGPRWLSQCKASSFNLSECSIKPFFYKTRAEILGKNPTQVKKSFRDLRKLPIKANKQTAQSGKLDWTCLLYTQLVRDLQHQKLERDPKRALLTSLLSRQLYSMCIRTTHSETTTAPWVSTHASHLYPPMFFIPHVSQ